MTKRYSNEDWRKATRRHKNLAVLKLDARTFAGNSPDETGALIGYDTEVLETLAEAQEDAARYLVFVHEPVRRLKGATTGPAVLRWLVTRALDMGLRQTLRCSLLQHRNARRDPPACPTEDAYHRHHDARARRAASSVICCAPTAAHDKTGDAP